MTTSTRDVPGAAGDPADHGPATDARGVEWADVVVVGARCAGSAAAVSFARRGRRVVVLNRMSFPSDTLSTHAMMVDGVRELASMGALEGVMAADPTPARRLTVRSGDVMLDERWPNLDGIDFSLCVPRIRQDIALVDAARAAGADVRERCSVEELVFSGGRAVGVRYRSAGHVHELRAKLVVGADGRRSVVAASTGSWRPYRGSRDERGAVFGYTDDPHADDEWGATVSVWRSRGSVAITFPCAPRGRLLTVLMPPNDEVPSWRTDHRDRWRREIDRHPSDGLGSRVGDAGPPERVTRVNDLVSYFRVSSGPGWALVGDAGHFKDPVIGRGMSDALHFGRRLGERVAALLDDRERLDRELRRWERERDHRLLPTYHWGNREGRNRADSPLTEEVIRSFAGDPAGSDLSVAFTRRRTPERVIGPEHLARGVIGALGRRDSHPSTLAREAVRELRAEVDVRRDRLARFRRTTRPTTPRITERSDFVFANSPLDPRRAPGAAPHQEESVTVRPTDATLDHVDPHRRRGRFYHAYARFLGTTPGRWAAMNVASRVDPWLMRVTGGRVGMGLVLPSALLETRGARSGQARSNAVLYFHDGDQPIILATAHGRPQHPAWYHNLKAHPDVTLGGVAFRAEEVGDADERQRLWGLADQVYPPCVDYRRRAGAAGRVIPIVRLVDRAETGPGPATR